MNRTGNTNYLLTPGPPFSDTYSIGRMAVEAEE